MDRSSARSLANDVAEELIVDLDSCMGENLPRLAEPIVDGVLRRGHIMMLTGPPKAGKSWSMAQLAYAVATGSEWMGFQCRQGTVCYVDTELDRSSLINRLNRVRGEMGLENSCGGIKLMSLRGRSVSAESITDTILGAYPDEKPSMVIIDSIYSIEEGDENSAGDMRAMFQTLGRLAAGGSAIAFAHHHAKGSAGSRNVIDRGSGSGVFGRFVDAMVDLTPTVPDDDQKALLEDRHGPNVVPMRMSFVLREFADPGSRSVVFDFPLLREVDGAFMDDAPEDGTAEAARRKGADTTKRKSEKRWSRIDEAIGRAVNQCTLDGVEPTRENVRERISVEGVDEVSRGQIRSWTRDGAETKWRCGDKASGYVLQCIDGDWSSGA